MISRPKIARLPGGRDWDGHGDGLVVAGVTPIQIGETLFMPATEMRTGLSVNGGTRFITLLLNHNDFGVSQSLTVDGARQLAASLNSIADQMEAAAHDQANAAIEKARSAQGPAK